MKRSEINKIMLEAKNLFEEYKIILPKFAYWSKADWATKGEEVQEIKDNMLGWDITDFGSGDFSKIGLFLFCVRNGNQKNKDKYPKPYAEKIMMVKEKQITPMHYHWSKMEDIINAGGGNLIIKLYNSTEDNKLADTDVSVSVDGVRYTFPAGYELRLEPGDSVTLTPGLFHRFWGEEGKGTVLVREVSMCNDDTCDNCFYDPAGRFPQIEEDEEPIHLLCHEYNK
jgi:D-lyxose ketol-isomerase